MENQIGSKPSAATIGMKTGTETSMIEMVSMKQPSTIQIAWISSSTPIGPTGSAVSVSCCAASSVSKLAGFMKTPKDMFCPQSISSTCCATSYWQEGDYIVDTFEVEAGDITFEPGNYQARIGFFTGSAPNWKNMKVTQAPAGAKDDADRVLIGTIALQ